MRFTTKAGQQDIGVGVEGAMDGITGSFGAGASFDHSSADLMADSKISLEANGGDPQIASAISDFSPQTDKTATFRGDLQAWLKTVPQFPRLVERVPNLQLITESHIPHRENRLIFHNVNNICLFSMLVVSCPNFRMNALASERPSRQIGEITRAGRARPGITSSGIQAREGRK